MMIAILLALVGALTYFVIDGLKKGFDLLKKIIVAVLCAATGVGIIMLILKKRKSAKEAKAPTC